MTTKKPSVSVFTLVSAEDRDLFRSYIGKIDRLYYEQHAQLKSFKKTPLLVPTKIPEPRLAPQAPLYDHEDPVTAEELLYFNHNGLHAKQQRKLKQGRFTPQADLDLHGFTVDQAYQELIDFLEHCACQNIRHIRIIHGKGNSSQNNYPILKNKLNNWLRRLPQVLAFSSAVKNDGGAGVLYVLLRAKLTDVY